MGAIFGSIIGVVFILGIALVGSISLKASATTFLSVAYGLYVVMLTGHILTMPQRDAPFCALLDREEIQAYRGYHLSIWFPDGAQMYSSILNMLRLAGFVWAGLCIWKGFYWYAAACVAYFFVSAHLITNLNPWHYVGIAAAQGNPLGLEEQAKIESIQRKRALYNE